MKRSPMPPRKKRLHPGQPPKRTTPLKSSGKKLEAMVSLKPSRPKAVPKAVKELLKARSGGLCEVGLVCGGKALGVDPAHREGKKSGGTSKAWSNLASNLLWSCRDCHDFIDQKQPKAAEKLGLKVREGVARPWEIPVLHKRLGWVLLDHEGGYRPAPAASHPDGKRPIPVVAVTVWELIQQNGPFAEVMERYKHLQCPGWSQPLEGLFTCGCGSYPFYLEQVA
ncbi:HNH endonuclease [Nonomuraea sp. NPDC049400]|uniref:HNH endonuclease n=1 Tax=Nonomuraea sp. NPDC049400 TaxID=3364352 RepID=UPI0037B30ED9